MDDNPTPNEPPRRAEPVEPVEPTVSDEEIDAYLLRPLADPLDDLNDPTPVSPPPGPSATPFPPPPPPPPPRPRVAVYGPKRLYRDPRGKIGGVASGLAHYFNIDVAIVRLIFILLTVSFLPVPIYIAAWIAIPKAPTWPPPGPPQKVRSGRLDSRALSAAALLVGLIVIASAAGRGPAAVIVPVILVAVGLYLLNQPDRATQTAADLNRGPTAGLDPQFANYSPYEPAVVSGAPAWAYETTAPAAVVAPQRRGPRIWLLLLLPLVSIAMIVGGGAIAATSTRDTTVMMSEATFAPKTIAAINESYNHSFGSVTIDFSEIDFSGEDVNVAVKNAFGETVIDVPENVLVTVTVNNSFGEVSVFGDTTSRSGEYERLQEDPAGSLHLSLDNSFGEVTITAS